MAITYISTMARKPADILDDEPYHLVFDPVPGMPDIVVEDDEELLDLSDSEEDKERRGIPKGIILAIILLAVVLPIVIMLSDAHFNGMSSSDRDTVRDSLELYHAHIEKGESESVIAAGYHDAALINFSRGQYDLAIDQMTMAAGYSQRSMNEYAAAVKDLSMDIQGAEWSYREKSYIYKAEEKYIEAFKSYRNGDLDNATRYQDDAGNYMKESSNYHVKR
jgi:hypothetical protein